MWWDSVGWGMMSGVVKASLAGRKNRERTIKHQTVLTPWMSKLIRHTTPERTSCTHYLFSNSNTP